MDLLFIIVGVGGIGGNVARDLPKLLVNRGSDNYKMFLIDGDIVEQKNLVRQPYQKQDIGLNKARALAKKINSFYEVSCFYMDKYITNEELETLCKKYANNFPVFIGCVDNNATRKLIEKAFLKQDCAVYIDGANSLYDGNVYVARMENGKKIGPLRSEYYELTDDVNPGLKGCEELAASGETQILITNNKVASVMLSHLHELIAREDLIKEGVTVIERYQTLHY